MFERQTPYTLEAYTLEAYTLCPTPYIPLAPPLHAGEHAEQHPDIRPAEPVAGRPAEGHRHAALQRGHAEGRVGAEKLEAHGEATPVQLPPTDTH